MMFHPKHVLIKKMNFKKIFWFIKAISYFVLLRKIIITLIITPIITIIITITNE